MNCTFKFLANLNGLVCRIMYRVDRKKEDPLPVEGPVLLVSNHSSYSDPLVLMASVHRPIHFLMAREIFELPHLQWAFHAMGCIPVSRNRVEIGAIRAVLRLLENGEVVGLFPEGGIEAYREESGYVGMAYLALKTGTSVVPVSILWDGPRPKRIIQSLLVKGRAQVRFGLPIPIVKNSHPTRQELEQMTTTIMNTIQELKHSQFHKE